ncbi:hypothetical protein, partial [Streptococcus pneumoniae]|uniref:hypothetical protein n=1 Tax=Streptococcus pneumoniae TaxID=1313 RepID=UPI001E54C8AF
AMPTHHTKFTFAAVAVATTDHTTSGGSGSLKIYTFPEGLIKVDGCVANLTTLKTTSTITTTAALVHAIGSVAEGG